MKPITTLLLLFTIVPLVSTAHGQEGKKYLKAFPKASKGMTRYVIHLPDKKRGEDSNFRVEIIVGKEILTDGVNKVRLGGKIEAKPLKGWGFTYYQVDEFGQPMSTLIGVPEGTPKKKKFVSLPSKTINYNSRVPLVIYVPQGGEVRYRVWKASEPQKAKKD